MVTSGTSSKLFATTFLSLLQWCFQVVVQSMASSMVALLFASVDLVFSIFANLRAVMILSLRPSAPTSAFFAELQIVSGGERVQKPVLTNIGTVAA